jgi:cytochrome c peroxidase
MIYYIAESSVFELPMISRFALLNKLLFFTLILLLFVTYPISASASEKQYLSQQLEIFIKGSAGVRDFNSFILPDSDDYRNIPSDPMNVLSAEKVRLGKFLFHETALSVNTSNPKHRKQSSCASCHFAQAGFRSDLSLGLGAGGMGLGKSRKPDLNTPYVDKQKILTPSVLNSAFQNVMLWDGRAGSTGINANESQIKKTYINRYGLHGLESQAIDAMKVHQLATSGIIEISEYQKMFAEAFPDRPFVSTKIEDKKRAAFAISAYERTLLSNQAPFQKWLKGDKDAMSKSELRGAIVFFKSSCVQCHSGPSLANTEFHALGFRDHPNEISGLNLGRSGVTKNRDDDFKFKVPQLYNLKDSTPYGHGASFKTIREVVEYFNRGEPDNLASKYSGNLSVLLKPLNLNKQQISDLSIFLETGLRDPNLIRYVPTALPSKLCFPNNDPVSVRELKCK